MIHSTQQSQYRKAYRKPDYRIPKIHLKFELDETKTRVTTQLEIIANTHQHKPLILNGENQILHRIAIDNKILTSDQYHLDDHTLKLFKVPQHFTLTLETEINPKENKALSGLYLSNGIFCTQCEPEGFRRITYFLDRPDVLSQYTTTIIADTKKYPFLLSNGNPLPQNILPDGRHTITWEDPFPKPSYLFALVAGDLDVLEDFFMTQSGKKVTLRLFCEKGYREHCHFAMEALKKAFAWDEKRYGREYDLDIFMLVAIRDFNMGAMENKGLNIFNAKYIYATPLTATDRDRQNIDSVVAHEYFHNWSGNRVTCRDWFQLSLKEGLTVFREQSFDEEITEDPTIRIQQAERLRSVQFPEDRGPLAHPVRPDTYIEIDNFYTTTVYEKGAEVIRMIKTILGEQDFRRGMDCYFERFDGQAVTCDNFIKTFQETSGFNFSKFKRWYSQAGTPTLQVKDHFNAAKNQYRLTIQKTSPQTMHLPLNCALLDDQGKTISCSLNHDKNLVQDTHTLHITQRNQTFTFNNIPQKPIPSFLRGFSAPIVLDYPYTDSALALLMAHDTDPFAQWEASQIYAKRILLSLMQDIKKHHTPHISNDFMNTLKTVLTSTIHPALKAYMLKMPVEEEWFGLLEQVDIDAVHTAHNTLKTTIARVLEKEFLETYHRNLSRVPYQYTPQQVAERALKNRCLHYLIMLKESAHLTLAQQQFKTADNMTDQLEALSALSQVDCVAWCEARDAFYTQWQNNPLVIDKWFTLQARSNQSQALERIFLLTEHPDFNIKNPNRVYALLLAFSHYNSSVFHDRSGRGYQLLTDHILKIDTFNPNVAARLSKAFAPFRQLDETRKKLISHQLGRILKTPQISKGLTEIIRNITSTPHTT